MGWTDPSGHVWATGEVVSAADMNTYIRLNLEESASDKVTTAGDIVQATGANALARLGIGNAKERLAVNSGGTALEYVGPDILDRDLSEVDVANNAAETTIYSHTIPAGILGSTGGFRATVGGDALVNVAGTVVLRIKLGATTALTTITFNPTDSAFRYRWWLVILCMNSATDAQKWGAFFQAVISEEGFAWQLGNSNTAIQGAGYGTSGEDTSGALLLNITVDWSAANASLSWRKEMAVLELIPPA